MRQGVRDVVAVAFREAMRQEDVRGAGDAQAEGDVRTACDGADADGRVTLIVACAGSLEVEAGGSGLALRAPDGCVVPAGMPWHATAGEDGCALATVLLDVPALGQMLPGPLRPDAPLRLLGKRGAETRVVPGLCSDDLRVLLRRLSFMLTLESERNRFTVLGMVGDLLACLERGLTEADGARGALRADDVMAYLYDHLADATLRGTADHFFCHPNSIANLLRRSCGASFSDVLATMRMENAALLLQTTSRTVQDVAATCGYRNMTHFYALFRARYGANPGEWRAAQVQLAS